MSTPYLRRATDEELELLVYKNAELMLLEPPDAYDIEQSRMFVENGCVVVFPGYSTDHPGYCGRVLVVVYPASPGCAQTWTFSPDGEIELAGTVEDVPLDFNGMTFKK